MVLNHADGEGDAARLKLPADIEILLSRLLMTQSSIA
jgi:hypothetical protein